MSYGDAISTRDRVSIATVLEHVAYETGRDLVDILGPRRHRRLTWARYAAAWLARRHTGKSVTQIAHAFGGRDHSTICHEVKRAEQLRATDDLFRELTDTLDVTLGAAA